MKAINTLTMTVGLTFACLASAPTAAQSCSVPGASSTQHVVLGEVLVFGEVRIRIAAADPDQG